jgi:hypothetical protein
MAVRNTAVSISKNRENTGKRSVPNPKPEYSVSREPKRAANDIRIRLSMGLIYFGFLRSD